MTEIDALFMALWQDYVSRLCPSAQRLHDLLYEGEPLRNDHIALRTFDLPNVGLEVLAAPFIEQGYQAAGKYTFVAKKLQAQHFEHTDPRLPKVFISELQVAKCSPVVQHIVTALVSQVASESMHSSTFLSAGRPWQVSFTDYQTLANESEYAAWLAAHGYGANHFTVSVNQLQRFNQVDEVNRYLQQKGFTLNTTGGEVKGTPEVFLEQSATMADNVNVVFSDQRADIPGGFYEFAKRYPMANGLLYQGFVEASADKIFESTNQ